MSVFATPSGSRASRRLALIFAVLQALTAAASAAVQDEEELPKVVPVAVEVRAEGDDLSETGRFDLVLSFVPEEDIDRTWSLRLALRHGRDIVLDRDHGPLTPTRSWRKGAEIAYRLPTTLPIETLRSLEGEIVFEVGFVDPSSRKTVPPRGAPGGTPGTAVAGRMEIPRFETFDDGDRRDAILARAAELAKTGDRAAAWEVLEAGLRLAVEDDIKRAFRDAMLALGDVPPRALNPTEEETVRRRIADEKRRHLRQVSGRFYDRGEFHGALLILDEIGGALEEDADAAVLGAVDEVDRVTKDRQDLLRRIRERISDEDRQEAESIGTKIEAGPKLLDQARKMKAKGRIALARALALAVRFHDEQAVRDEAYRLVAELEEALVAAVPADEREAVRAEVEHEAWGRTVAVPTRNFILIGPEKLVEGIPEESRARFDLAYVFLTDLFGRVPNPEGDRITVYFKELWEFAGGVAGGRTIDIGRARNRAGQRLDNGLMYHELTHCIESVQPKFHGFTEGLADLGAFFCEENLAPKPPPRRAAEGPLEAFRKHYLERDLEYWRIPEYAPSCGFFLHFVHSYARRDDGRHDWKPLRGFFREFRDAPVRDGREHQIVRAWAFYLMRAFGAEVFDDLVKFRFPLEESDRRAIGLELQHFSEARIVDFDENDAPRDALQEHPNSYLPRDLLVRDMLAMVRRNAAPEDVEDFARRELGMLMDWSVIGPFKGEGADPDARVFPPERGIDFEARYTSGPNQCFWRRPGDKPPARLSPTGWVRFDYPYQDDTAIYAVTWVEVPEATLVSAHLRGDDDVTLFVNDDLAGKYRGRGWNASTRLWWRGPVAEVADAIRFPARLRKGANKILVKIKNRGGPAGFALALTTADGRAISDLDATARPATPEAAAGASEKEGRLRSLLRHRFDSKSFRSKLDVAAGRFKVRSKRLVGESTDGAVVWRPYDVRPGVRKDSPSNLAWLKDKATRDLGDFRLELALDAEKPKIVVTFMGEGNDDGLSGWNLLLFPAGERLAARLERYDRLVYQEAPFEIGDPTEEPRILVLDHRDGRLTVTLDQTTIFDRVSIRPIPGRHRVGFATWGPDTKLAWFDLEAPRER